MKCFNCKYKKIKIYEVCSKYNFIITFFEKGCKSFEEVKWDRHQEKKEAKK